MTYYVLSLVVSTVVAIVAMLEKPSASLASSRAWRFAAILASKSVELAAEAPGPERVVEYIYIRTKMEQMKSRNLLTQLGPTLAILWGACALSR